MDIYHNNAHYATGMLVDHPVMDFVPRIYVRSMYFAYL